MMKDLFILESSKEEIDGYVFASGQRNGVSCK